MQMSSNTWETLWPHWLAIFWVTLGRPARAIGLWSRLIAAHGPRQAWVSSRAHLLAQSGQDAAAVRDYEWLCSQPGPRAADWFNHGFLLEQAGEIGKAADCFQKAIDLDDQLDRAWYGLGLCLVRQGKLDDAIHALTRNTQLQPMSPHGWIQLARVHEQRQEPEQVLKIIRHLQGFEPKVAAELMRESGLSLSSGRA